jgi:hypothetical protein
MDKLDFTLEIKQEDVKENGVFTGYASTFGGEPDSYGDVVENGAFKSSIGNGGRNRNGISLLWQHDHKQPIGVWQQLVEDSRGLAVQGQLALDVQLGKEAHSLMKIGAVKGLSIGYDTVDYEYNQETKIRTLKEVNLWEISLVTFPANVHSSITGVKAFEEAQTIREFERALRDAGLSSRQAVYVISLCKDSFNESRRDCESYNVAKAIQLMMANNLQ